MNYSEYSCPCGGRTERRKIDTIKSGFFKPRYIFTYYYHCLDCEEDSHSFTADITHKFR